MWIALVIAATVQAPDVKPAESPPPPESPQQDTDGDGIADADEDANHNGIVDPGESSPNSADTDKDNVPDAVERRLGTDPSSATDVPPIPEPLLVDLVRNLGSRRGELETNVLASSAFGSIEWGPEIEYVPIRNFGVEFELPFRDAKVAALKFGAQYTVGAIDTRRLELGVLGAYEHGVVTDERRILLAAVTGARISSSVQFLTIAGPTFEFSRARPIPGATVNPSVFYQPSRYVTTGLELGYRVESEARSMGTVLPQIHLNATSHVKVQVGFGGRVLVGREVRPLAAIRVSYEL